MNITIAPESENHHIKSLGGHCGGPLGVLLIVDTGTKVRGYRLKCNGDAQALKDALLVAFETDSNFEPDNVVITAVR